MTHDQTKVREAIEKKVFEVDHLLGYELCKALTEDLCKIIPQSLTHASPAPEVVTVEELMRSITGYGGKEKPNPDSPLMRALSYIPSQFPNGVIVIIKKDDDDDDGLDPRTPKYGVAP